MADIALSKGVRQNLLAMQNTVDLMGARRTGSPPAEGQPALDNPTSYFVAAGLENRANDLSRILDSMGLGIKTIEAADNGIKGIKRLIETAQGTARQALPGRLLDRRDAVVADTPARRRHPFRDGRRRDGEDRRHDGDLHGRPGRDAAGRHDAGARRRDQRDERPQRRRRPPLVHASIDETGKLVIENVAGGDLTVGVTNDAGGSTTRTPSPTCSIRCRAEGRRPRPTPPPSTRSGSPWRSSSRA